MTTSGLIRLSSVAFALLFLCRSVLAAKTGNDPDDDHDSSSTSLKLKRQSSSTQSQNSAGSPLGNAADHATSLFGPGEFQIIGFGTGGYGQGTHTVSEQHTVKQTTTVSETTFVTQTTFQSTFVPEVVLPGTVSRIVIPAHFVQTPLQTKVPVTTKHQVTTSHTVKTTKNVAAIQGGFGGAGAEARYFFSRWLGVGVEGDWLEGNGSSGTTLTTITARLVRDSNAYYIFGGTGVQFSEHYTQAIGKLGIGVEHRFLAGTGVFADVAWMFGSNENAAVCRGGFRWGF